MKMNNVAGGDFRRPQKIASNLSEDGTSPVAEDVGSLNGDAPRLAPGQHVKVVLWRPWVHLHANHLRYPRRKGGQREDRGETEGRQKERQREDKLKEGRTHKGQPM